jgi:hypothetical protein
MRRGDIEKKHVTLFDNIYSDPKFAVEAESA